MLNRVCVLILTCSLAACSTLPEQNSVNHEQNETPVETVYQVTKVDDARQAPKAVMQLLDTAKQLSNQNKFEAAAFQIERAIRIAPRYPESYYRLAEVRLWQGNKIAANTLAKRALSLGATGELKEQANSLIRNTI